MINSNRVGIGLRLSLLLATIFAASPVSAQELERVPPPTCTRFVQRASSVLAGSTVVTQVSNHGTISSPGNDSTDIRWSGLGYGYEFGIFVGGEVPGKGTHGLSVPKMDRFGSVARDQFGDTLWVQRIVSDGLVSHGGDWSPDRTEAWGWRPVDCAVSPASAHSSCFADAVVDETFVMNDLGNREFDYYPFQGDSTWQGLGVQVEARLVQSRDPALRDVLFLIHRVENRSRVDIDKLFIGMWGDPHVGGARNYQDDHARFLPELGLVEVWDADGVADTPGLTPGYFGYQFLEADTGLTSLTVTPFNDLDPADDARLWDLVQPGRFESVPQRPGDDVYIFGSGPYKLRVGESIRFAAALLLATTSSELREKAGLAQDAFARECPPPPPPPSPGPFYVPRRDAEPTNPPPLNPIGAVCPQQCGCEDPLTPCEEASCAWMGGPALDPFVVTPSRLREPLMDAPASVSVVPGEAFVRDAGRSPAATLRHTLGVDLAQVGTNRHHVATRGFNQSTAGHNLLLVDHRQGAVPGLGYNSYALLPVASIDIAQAEVVRGSVSSLYGSRADHGAIQFLTKEPFDYPGTAVSASGGENGFLEGAARHARKLSDRFAYKVVGSYGQADDLLFKKDDSDQSGPDQFEIPDSRDETMTQGFVRGTLQYRHVPCACLTVTANVDYAGTKQNLLHETGEMFMDYRMGAGQLKVESDNLMAQTYYMKGDTKEAFDYRTRRPIIDESALFAAQARYRTMLFDERESLVLGVDYDRTDSETGGILDVSAAQKRLDPLAAWVGKLGQEETLDYPIHLGRHGRNEADDLVENLGAYVQSRTDLTDRVELQISGRLDLSNVIDPQLSPKFSLGFSPSSSHAFRLSVSRGFARPTSIQLFADFPVDGTSLLPIRAHGNLDGWRFSSDPKSTSLLPTSYGLLDDGVGIDLDRAFSAATDSLFSTGGLLEGWDALEDFLRARGASIDGLSEGVLRYDEDPEAQVVDSPRDIPELEPMDTRAIEIGYKGNFQNRTFVGIDFFYAKTKNHISRLRSITPFVFVPNVGDDLADVILQTFTDDELARYKLSRQDLVYLYGTVTESLTRRAVGIIEPEESGELFGGPPQILSWTNFGEADYFGIDLELRRIVNEQFSYFGNFSWLSDDYFDADDLEEAQGYELALNAPRFKFAAGVDRTFFDRLRVSVAGRYVDSFSVRSGIRSGEVDDYFLLDLGFGLPIDEVSPGLRLDVMAENLLDHEHVEWPGAPLIGRYVTARLTYSVP